MLDSRRWQEIFYPYPQNPERRWGLTQPLILSIEEALFSGVKRPECEVNHSLPSSAALDEWGYRGVLISP